MVRLQWWRDYFCIFNVQAFLGPAAHFPNIQITGTFTRVMAWDKMCKNTFGMEAEKCMENEASSSHRGIICLSPPTQNMPAPVKVSSHRKCGHLGTTLKLQFPSSPLTTGRGWNVPSARQASKTQTLKYEEVRDSEPLTPYKMQTIVETPTATQVMICCPCHPSARSVKQDRKPTLEHLPTRVPLSLVLKTVFA